MTATENQALPKAVEDFFCQDIPEPFQILGLKLLPLSIGRYRRMARHKIGFVSESSCRPNGKDLIIGVLICSMTCAEWDEISVSPKLPSAIASWMRQIHAAPPWYLTGRFGEILSATYIGKSWRKNHSFDLLEKMKLFKEYIDEAQKVPRFIRRNSNGGMSSSHWSHNIEITLCGELGWTQEQIEELPLSKAISLYYQFAESQGLITILTDTDFEQMKNNDAAIAKTLEDLKAKGMLDGV